MAIDLGTFSAKPATVVRDDVLRVIKNGLIRRGVAAPNVGPTTDWYLVATAIGNELAVVGANSIVSNEQQMPDSATGEGMQRIADLFNLAKQPAGGSVGGIIITCSATAPVPTDAELTDSAGQRFRVSTGGNYASGARVSIEAISVGSSTNHAVGDTLRWASAPTYCDDRVTVAAGGLINGINAEDDEALRARVMAVLQLPPGSGNWEQCAEVAEAADPRVQKAFVSPAVRGPSTVDIVVTAAPTSTSKSRALAATVMTGVVAPFVRGKLAEHADIGVNTVTDVNADVAFGLSIPEALTANPPGIGGGWLNGSPWPTPNATSTFRCTVTAVASTTSMTVDAASAPIAGVSRIAWLSPYTWTLYQAVVATVAGTAGAYAITLDKPLVGIAVGCYIWPDCVNAKLYVQTVLNAFALMGPGEKTYNPPALIRGFRHPPPATSWPYSLGPHLLRALAAAQEEVAAASFMYRTDAVSTITGTAGQIIPDSPYFPPATPAAPNIYVPRHIAFYRIP